MRCSNCGLCCEKTEMMLSNADVERRVRAQTRKFQHITTLKKAEMMVLRRGTGKTRRLTIISHRARLTRANRYFSTPHSILELQTCQGSFTACEFGHECARITRKAQLKYAERLDESE